MNQLKKKNGTAVNITSWGKLFGFDLIGEIGLGKPFDQLASGIEHPAIKPIHDHIQVLGVLQTVPWLLYLLGIVPGASSAYSEIFGFCAGQIRAKLDSWNGENEPSDIASWLVKPVAEGDATASPTLQSLDDDARVLLLAGRSVSTAINLCDVLLTRFNSDTTATTLTYMLYYLAKYPDIQAKLQGLLDKAFPGGSDHWSIDELGHVGYLDDCLAETLRLKPALPLGGPRETPAEGIQIDEVHIPGSIIVLVPTRQIQQDPRYWTDAEEFIPERWRERRDEMGTDNSPYMPFLLGKSSMTLLNVAKLIIC